MERRITCKVAFLLTKAAWAAALVFWLALPTLRCFSQDLYLLTATPTPQSTARFASTLYRVNVQSATLGKVRTVVGDDTGVDFVEADYDHRLLVIGFPLVVPSVFAVVNMDDPTAPSSVMIHHDPGSVVLNHYLLDMPGEGVMQALTIFGSPVDALGRPINNAGTGKLVVAPLIGAAKKGDALPWNDILYVRCDGYYGTGAGSDDSLWVRPSSDGMLTGDIRSAHPENLGIPVPPNLTPPLAKGEYLNLYVDNDEIAVIAREKEPSAVFVFDKTTQTWSRVSNPVGSSMVRGFRSWIAGIAVQGNRDHLRQSPGQEIRKAAQLPTGGTGRFQLSVEDLFSQSDLYFPGELFLYNAKTKKSYTISTGQGDSEVVLATDDAVYYRVNDTLYRAAVNSDSLGKPELVVKDPIIFQVHWAFLGPAQ